MGQLAIAIEAEALYAQFSGNIGVYRDDSHSRNCAWISFVTCGLLA